MTLLNGILPSITRRCELAHGRLQALHLLKRPTICSRSQPELGGLCTVRQGCLVDVEEDVTLLAQLIASSAILGGFFFEDAKARFPLSSTSFSISGDHKLI